MYSVTVIFLVGVGRGAVVLGRGVGRLVGVGGVGSPSPSDGFNHANFL